MRLLPLTLLMLPLAAAAQTLPVVAVDQQVFAAAEGSSIGYHEHVDGGTLDRESGWVPGFGVGARDIVSLYGLPPILAGIEYHRADDFIRYQGTNFDTGAPLSGSSGYNTDDIAGELGPTFLINPRLLIAPVVQAAITTGSAPSAVARTNTTPTSRWAPPSA